MAAIVRLHGKISLGLLLFVAYSCSAFTAVQTRRQSIVGTCSSIQSLENKDRPASTEPQPVEVGDFSVSTTSPTTPLPVTTVASVEQMPPMTSREILAAMGTSPRRILLSGLSGLGISLAGNLFGVTSILLNALPEDSVEQTGLDTYFPRGNYKRVTSNRHGYTFVIPKEWVADTSLELAKAQQRVGSLDYDMQSSLPPRNLPDAAFGPPGNSRKGRRSGDTNVSVLLSDIPPRYHSLSDMLGGPQQAAAAFMDTINVSPTRKGRLLAAQETATNVYQLEYRIDRTNAPPQGAISVIALLSSNENAYLTLTVVAPAIDWDRDSEPLRKIVSSFRLLSS